MALDSMGSKILIVDDEPDLEQLIRQKFRRTIRSGEFEFVFARHGGEALDHLKQDPALEIVMSDINMPVMDGLTLLSRLTEIKRLLRTVIVSAYGDIRNIRTAMNRGAYDFLTKPIDFADFEATLRKTIQDLNAVKAGFQARQDLNATLTVLASEMDLVPLLTKIINTISTMLGAERSSLFLNDPKTGELYTEVGEGLGSRQIRMPNTRGIAGAVFHSGRAINLSDPYSDPRFNPDIDRETGYQTRSLLCVPVVTKQGLTIGVTQVLNKKDGAFTGEDEARLRAFTSQISITLQNATLFEEVRRVKNYNESILESMSSGVLTLDQDSVLATCNAAGLRILGLESPDIVGRPAADFFAEGNIWVLDKLRKVEETRSSHVTIDTVLDFPNGSVSCNVAVLPLTDPADNRSGTLILIDDITNEKRMKSTMSRYLDPSLVDRLLESGGDHVLGGQNKQATILFADIRSFTRLTEDLGAERTVSLLNEFFTMMVDCVQQEGGVLDKFIGDALMAEFGVPLTHEDDEDRAVRTAILMHRKLAEYNRRRAAEGAPPLQIRVGINTSVVVSGNIGSPKRMEYTVVGDGVNLAARIESACKQYGSGILVGEPTYKALRGRYRTRELDRILVQGKTEPVGVIEVLDYHTEESFPNLEPTVEAFKAGLDAYRGRNWSAAIDAFGEALALNPGDQASRTYLERCGRFAGSPPPEDWDGVWILDYK